MNWSALSGLYKSADGDGGVVIDGSVPVLPGLTSIEVSPSAPVIGVGFTQPFTATGSFSDGTQKDVTNNVVWTSSDPTIAVINSDGLASGISSGLANIFAANANTNGQSTLQVTGASLSSVTVSPASASIAMGTKQQFSAMGVYSDGTMVDLTSALTWLSSNTNIATVSNTVGTQGVAKGVAVGTTTISVPNSSSAMLEVKAVTLSSIVVTPVNAAIAEGTMIQIKAVGTFTDNSTQDLTTQVAWTVSPSGSASFGAAVGAEGRCTAGSSAGTINVSAAFNGAMGSTSLTVTAATLTSITITNHQTNTNTCMMSAKGIFSDASTQDLTKQVVWTYSNPNHVGSLYFSSVVGQEGVAYASGFTLATITASLLGVTGSIMTSCGQFN